MWLSKIFRKVFSSKKNEVEKVNIFSKEFKQNCYEYYPKFYHLDDFVFLKNSDCYAVFKYDVAKSILANSDDYSAKVNRLFDPVLLGNDSSSHSLKKKQLFKSLYVDRKNEVFSETEFLDLIFEKLMSSAASHASFNIVDKVVNPFILTCILYEFGFNKIPFEIDLLNDKSEIDSICDSVKSIYMNFDQLDNTIIENLQPSSISNFSKHILEMIEREEESELNFFKFLFYSGTETTSSLISSTLFQLHDDEISREKLFSQSDYIQPLLNEISRLYSPAQFTFRITTKPIYSNNQLIKEGSKIAISIGAANRDPAVFKNPTVFCDQRSESNISFGFGRHKCVGEKLSIKLAKAFFDRYKSYIKVFEMACPPEYDNSFVFQMTKLQLQKIN